MSLPVVCGERQHRSHLALTQSASLGTVGRDESSVACHGSCLYRRVFTVNARPEELPRSMNESSSLGIDFIDQPQQQPTCGLVRRRQRLGGILSLRLNRSYRPHRRPSNGRVYSASGRSSQRSVGSSTQVRNSAHSVRRTSDETSCVLACIRSRGQCSAPSIAFCAGFADRQHVGNSQGSEWRCPARSDCERHVACATGHA